MAVEMQRRLFITAAIAALATTVLPGSMAQADQGRGRGKGGGGRGPPDRRDGGGRDRRDDGRREQWRRDDGRRDDGRRDDGRRDGGPGRGRYLREDDGPRGERRRYEDGPAPPPDSRPARRGGYLPDSYRGGVVDDYQRFRLRPPPRGYSWVRVNGGYALVSVEDGRIFDVIPD